MSTSHCKFSAELSFITQLTSGTLVSTSSKPSIKSLLISPEPRSSSGLNYKRNLLLESNLFEDSMVRIGKNSALEESDVVFINKIGYCACLFKIVILFVACYNII